MIDAASERFFRAFGVRLNGFACFEQDVGQTRSYVNGIAVQPDGRILTGSPFSYYTVGGAPVTSNGALVIDDSAVVTHYHSGVPFSGNAIAITSLFTTLDEGDATGTGALVRDEGDSILFAPTYTYDEGDST